MFRLQVNKQIIVSTLATAVLALAIGCGANSQQEPVADTASTTSGGGTGVADTSGGSPSTAGSSGTRGPSVTGSSLGTTGGSSTSGSTVGTGGQEVAGGSGTGTTSR